MTSWGGQAIDLTGLKRSASNALAGLFGTYLGPRGVFQIMEYRCLLPVGLALSTGCRGSATSPARLESQKIEFGLVSLSCPVVGKSHYDLHIFWPSLTPLVIREGVVICQKCEIHSKQLSSTQIQGLTYSAGTMDHF